jgi:protein-S-isoprenylcysteine O-methyltransferase Ste14
MMAEFKIIYWLGLVAQIVIRAPFATSVRSSQKTERRVSRTEKTLLALLSFGIVFPLIYSLTNWLDFANYRLPVWMGWLGALLLACGLYLFARGHRDLRSNWSPSLEIYAGHTLVTSGIYRYIRHPMYASQWLMSFAQILLLQNWLAGPIALLIFIPFYLLRVREEEKMMLDTFGDEYREYMKNVGGVIPKSLSPRQ